MFDKLKKSHKKKRRKENILKMLSYLIKSKNHENSCSRRSMMSH